MKPLFIIALFVSVSFVEGGFRPVTPNAPTHPLANAHHPSFADVTHHYYTPEQLEFHKQQLQKQQEEMIKYQKEHEQIAFVDGFQCDYVYLEATRYPGLVLVEFAQEPITESERTEKGSDNQKPQNQKRIVVGHGLVPLVDESGSITHALHLEKSNPTSAPTEKSQTKFKVHKPSQRPPKKIHFYAENNIVIVATKEGVLKSAKVDDKIEFPVYDATFELVAHDAILNKGKSNQDEYKNQASHDYRFMIRSVQNPQLYLTVDPESHKILLAENAVHLWSAKAGKRPESMVIESVGHGFLSVKAEEGSIVELQEKIEDSDGFYMVPSLLFQYYYGNLPLMSMNPENLMTSKISLQGHKERHEPMQISNSDPDLDPTTEFFIREPFFDIPETQGYILESASYPGSYLIHKKDLVVVSKVDIKDKEQALNAIWSIKSAQCAKEIQVPKVNGQVYHDPKNL